MPIWYDIFINKYGKVLELMKSKVLQQDHEDIIALHRAMKPEERLIAFFNHSKLIQQLHQSGINYRKKHPHP